MLKILIVSDTHGNIELLDSVVSANQTCDLVIHLGDKVSDIQEVMKNYPKMALLSALGNCDIVSMFSNNNTEGTFTAEERRIFYTHGHKYNVNFGIDYLVSQATLNKADVVLFGHTHVAFSSEKNGIVVINPGSLAHARDGSNGTYCVAQITGKSIKYEIKEV